MTSTPQQVFLVDDEEALLRIIGRSLASLGVIVTSFKSAEDCLARCIHERCDLLLSDVNMPGLSGLDLLVKFKQLQPQVPVLMMSGYGDIPMALQAVKAGAMDFLEKPLDERSLLPKVQQALAQSAALTKIKFTEMEQRILGLVAQGKTSREIAEVLSRSIRTVENHRLRIMQKTGIPNSAGLVHFALTHGFS